MTPAESLHRRILSELDSLNNAQRLRYDAYYVISLDPTAIPKVDRKDVIGLADAITDQFLDLASADLDRMTSDQVYQGMWTEVSRIMEQRNLVSSPKGACQIGILEAMAEAADAL